MSKLIDQTFDRLISETDVETFRKQGAAAKAAYDEMETALQQLSVEATVSGKDKIQIVGTNPSGYIKIVNPARGGVFYKTTDLEALKKAFVSAVDKAIAETDKISKKYKDAIKKLSDGIKDA